MGKHWVDCGCRTDAHPRGQHPEPTPPTDENVSPRTHPEHFCQRCGGPNLMCWHAPSPLWNTVMRDAEGLEKLSIVCPRCFGELAREAGVADYFCLTTHDAKVPLPSVFGDGRVWNAEKCRWVEREASSPATPVMGRKILHTAQNRMLPRETFLEIASLLAGSEFVTEIRQANGQETIRTVNGGKYTLVAPRPGVRGHGVDDVILLDVERLVEALLAVNDHRPPECGTECPVRMEFVDLVPRIAAEYARLAHPDSDGDAR